jgi:hypothetical protein
MGDATAVTDLTASYSAGGVWVGGAPTSKQPNLRFLLKWKEGRVEHEEPFTIPITRVQRLVPNGTYEGEKLWSILLHDGTDIKVYNDRLELTKRGTLTPSVRKYEWYSLEAYRYEGHPVELWGFQGKARSASGRMGSYSIPINEIVLIQCRPGTQPR